MFIVSALQTPPLFIEGVPVGRGRYKRSAEGLFLLRTSVGNVFAGRRERQLPPETTLGN